MLLTSLFRKMAFGWLITGAIYLGGLTAPTQAVVQPAAELTQTTLGSTSTYNIVLHNNSTAGETFSTFWFAWLPGQDYMAVSPSAVIAPEGWTAAITHSGAADGYGIRFTATTPLAAGATVSGFSFKSTSTLTHLQGKSIFFPSTPVLTSQVFSTSNVTFVVAAPSLFHLVASFTGANGSKPSSALVLGTDGNFYGTTLEGGTTGHGTVYKMTPAGVLSSLASFHLTDGSLPDASLVQGPGNAFYGSTSEGGNEEGTLFKITSAGALTTLVRFSSAVGKTPEGAMIRGSDGNFYGTTQNGGQFNLGTIFRLTPAGALTRLISFSGSNGSQPQAGLVQDGAGNFYGTTLFGGTSDAGTIFRLTPAGVLTTVASFNDENGSHPAGSLVLAADGALYGTTSEGGNSNDGTVFKVTPAGVLTSLVSFRTTKGSSPQAGLIQADGFFYGTTYAGGVFGKGTVFKISRTGALTTLLSFDGSNGSNPLGSLVKGPDGHLYGTASEFLVGGPGKIFRITVPKAQTISFPSGTTAIAGHKATLKATASSGLPVTYSVISGPATISGKVVSFNGGGTVVLAADQPGNFEFKAAPQVTVTITVSKVAQTIGAFPVIAPKTFGAAPFAITLPTASSESGVRVTVKSGRATISGNIVRLTGAGTVTLAANQPGNAIYLAAPEVTTSFTVNKADQTITFPTIGVQSVGAVLTLQATASSGLGITYTVTGPATLSGRTLTVTGAGRVSVVAHQAGNISYNAAPNVTRSFTAR